MVFFGSSVYLDSMDFGISFTVSGAMLNVLHWIHIGSNAYDEYTFVPWLNKNVYRRTVDLSHICIQ
ncbi:hypothetical protein SAMN05445850_5600 [Paraburkholderia tuberum]|uniref:Uncharacterized protein n=1 Tax=Paraburkholderia tuberum TaxID=157910 RepID=A0A1H1JSY2_9BURK|nr:hypothetical protein SAMN05445850_5600 [Paraburkholderia tuberum]